MNYRFSWNSLLVEWWVQGLARNYFARKVTLSVQVIDVLCRMAICTIFVLVKAAGRMMVGIFMANIEFS